MRRRRLLALLALLAAATLAPAAALAKGAGGGGGGGNSPGDGKYRFTKLQTITVEMWDQGGLFHVVNMDLVLVHTEEAKVEKSVAEQIRKRLSAVSWEDYSGSNPAPMIKALALEVVRKSPGGDQVVEVLINRLLFR
ncbi:MAG: hypothetical protein ACM31L_07325 [Actinomycetota bacterium]